jgi:hypothetical protein
MDWRLGDGEVERDISPLFQILFQMQSTNSLFLTLAMKIDYEL